MKIEGSSLLHEIVIVQTKKCSKCGNVFELTTEFFGKRVDSKDGFKGICKKCQSENRMNWHNANRDAQLEKMKEYTSSNRDVLICKKREYNREKRDVNVAKCREYYEKNRESVLAQCKEFRDANKEEINKRRRERRESDLETYRMKRQEYSSKNIEKLRMFARKYRAERYNSDELYRIKHCVRTRVLIAVRRGSSRKKGKTFDLIGCSAAELRNHLENKFEKGMSWENHGEWHIDHIVPCAVFDLTKKEEQQKCFHYSNLQPLWARDNLRKGASLDHF